jgi:glycosyltransferase involved in cell wall biosynthesis
MSATKLFSVSRPAGTALFGHAVENDRRYSLLPCGIDTDDFDPESREAVRASLGMTTDQIALAHVGNFRPAKNQRFAIDVVRELIESGHKAMLFLIGDGATRRDLERYVASTSLDGQVHFLGVRHDVPRLLPAFDVFVFPSLYEGLPLACIEAQAAGLPVLISDTVTSEVCLLPHLVSRHSLGEGPGRWASACTKVVQTTRIDRRQALNDVCRWWFWFSVY